ncbi:DUF4349 domain-containing protein [Aquimarina algicola]|uniref:DUF4349 domain-containing protein n=1 Tax=Aquimarina algicola TaxID=2589995 RepID=A0A504ISR3_9FLAO|nr:DUF4349 domain-containing protein [Aquimarina algicola]TPN81386.1 DUF4349 domain-containing protein [Aquimarina algicola]
MKTIGLTSISKISLVAIFMMISCSNHRQSSEPLSEDIILEESTEKALLNTIEVEETPSTGNDDAITSQQLKIIKNADCKIKVTNVKETTRLAKALASRYKGYISQEKYTNTNYTKENFFTIRVPRDHFDTVLDSITDTADFIDYKNISTLDVTEEYVDVTSRLKTKFEVKERYESILRNRAKTVKDILLAEDKLGDLQEEIESSQGRLKYLSNKVAYSTIQMNVYETVIPEEEPESYTPNFLDKATKGLKFGWSIIENLTLSLFYIWPLILLGIMIFIYFKWIRK